MFEFSLENGMRQLKGGLMCLVLNVVAAVLFVILLAVVKDPTGLMVVTIIFSIVIGILGLLTLIKLIFGIVVYHAERTSNVLVEIYKDDNTSNLKEKKSKKVVVVEKQTKYDNLDVQKNNKIENSEVKRWYFDEKTGDLVAFLSNDLVYSVSGLDSKFKNEWKQLTWDQKTELFNTKLIKKAKLFKK